MQSSRKAGLLVLVTLLLWPFLRAQEPDARQAWPYQALRETPPPTVRSTDWPRGAIDRFVLAALEREGLAPVEPAAPRVLLRRLSFDLLGLPPTPEQLEVFEAAASRNLDEALARLVDELLASPHYGERWARHWLDVARYAEDQAHSGGHNAHAYRYRDWVVRAFNEDLPLADFVRRQIAGDLLPASDDESRDERFLRLGGLGFFGLGAVYYKNSDKAKAMADELDDRIDTLTRGFLALTVSCARCHDHKFDPISIEDYYAVAGVFKGSRPGHAPLADPREIQARGEAIARVQEKEKEINAWLELQGRRHSGRELEQLGEWLRRAWKMRALERAQSKPDVARIAKDAGVYPHFVSRWRDFAGRGQEKLPPELFALFERPAAVGTKSFAELEPPPEVESEILAIERLALEARRRHLADDEQPSKEGERLLQAIWLGKDAPLWLDAKRSEELALTGSDRLELAASRAELHEIRRRVPPEIPLVPSIAGKGQAMQVMLRGDPAKPGDWVARGFLEILDPGARPAESEAARAREYTRLDLAEAIASPANPLTARVFVNRVWQWHFGRGLVATASNFGKLGERPSHPELLDHLTRRFLESGQSLKWLHREILLSATYRLSSSADPALRERDAENRWLGRFRARRLEVEEMRDALLAVSGELDRRLGGATFSIGDTGGRRRTVYARISRHIPSEFLRMFDFPDANVTAAERLSTIVPQQQLFALNSSFVVERARAFAERLRAERSSDEDRVRRAYELAFARQPEAAELELALRFLSQPTAEGDRLSLWVQYSQALLASNEFLHVD